MNDERQESIHPSNREGHQPLLRMTNLEELGAQAKYDPAGLAGLCSVSLRQLERHFRDHKGTTPRKWLRQLQCRKARELIEKGYSTKAAAAEVHCSSEAVLCHFFKKVYGRPPQFFAP
jgi:transcriptional regulator GlxA family with amidase domain